MNVRDKCNVDVMAKKGLFSSPNKRILEDQKDCLFMFLALQLKSKFSRFFFSPQLVNSVKFLPPSTKDIARLCISVLSCFVTYMTLYYGKTDGDFCQILKFRRRSNFQTFFILDLDDLVWSRIQFKQ